MKTDKKIFTLIVTVQNKPGVLFKIAGMIRRRRFNIESLTVSHTQIKDISRFTILVLGDKQTIEKVSKQLYRIVEVIKVSQPENSEMVSRELALFKISLHKKNSKAEIASIIKYFRAKAVSLTPNNMIIEVTGDEEKIDAFYKNMKKYGVVEFVRTGRTALYK